MTSNAALGAVGEAQIALRFQHQGCVVSLPLMRAAPYDLVVDMGGKLYRVQVKLIGAARTSVDLGRRGQGRRAAYEPDAIDLLAVAQGDEAYLLPWPMPNRHTFTLTESRKRDFQFETVLGRLLAGRFGAGGAGPSRTDDGGYGSGGDCGISVRHEFRPVSCQRGR